MQKTDTVLIPAGMPDSQQLADRCGDKIQRCIVCSKAGTPDNVLVVPLPSTEQLAFGICADCAKLPQPQLQQVISGMVQLFIRCASHIETNPN